MLLMVKRAVTAVMLLAALAACSNNAKSNAGGSPQPGGTANAAATPDCNGQSPVWAIARAKVYLLPDDPHYGKTKHAAYMCLSDAQAQGYRHGRGPGRRHHRRHHGPGAVNPNPFST